MNEEFKAVEAGIKLEGVLTLSVKEVANADFTSKILFKVIIQSTKKV